MESPFSFGSGQFNISSRGRRIEGPWAPAIFNSEMYKIGNLWVFLWSSRIQIWRKLCALCVELKLIRSCGFMNNEDLRSIRIFRPSELDLQHWTVSWPTYHHSFQNLTTILTISEGKKPLLWRKFEERMQRWYYKRALGKDIVDYGKGDFDDTAENVFFKM